MTRSNTRTTVDSLTCQGKQEEEEAVSDAHCGDKTLVVIQNWGVENVRKLPLQEGLIRKTAPTKENKRRSDTNSNRFTPPTNRRSFIPSLQTTRSSRDTVGPNWRENTHFSRMYKCSWGSLTRVRSASKLYHVFCFHKAILWTFLPPLGGAPARIRIKTKKNKRNEE